METTEIQYLGKKEDLELLVEGDKVNVELQHIKGIVTFLHNDDGVLRFIKRDNKRILRYYIEEFNIDIQNNTIIQRNSNSYSEPEIINKNDDLFHYKIYNKLIGESN